MFETKIHSFIFKQLEYFNINGENGIVYLT
jgi:hypothetical protein